MTLRLRPLFGLAACLTLAACGGKGGGTPPPPSGGSRTVSGTATYDYVPVTLAAGLDFAHVAARPIRDAVVQVTRGASVLATGSTDATGHYSVTFTDSGAGLPAVAVLARIASPPIEVRDNTDGATWAVGGDIPAGATTLNLHAAHGWTGSAYDPLKRAAAPFAILDTMTTAARAFVAVRPAVVFPALVVNWSPLNVPQSGGTGLAGGFIGTSHFNPGQGAPVGQIFILGKDGVDTDEFDDHVIAHEWGHYFEHNLSRSDSIGGQHSFGDILDPRVAFGEGYGDAIASILLPSPVYVDTQWNATPARTAFGWDTKNDPRDVGGTIDDPNPGPFSEASVMRFLYRVFAKDGIQAWDQVGVGLGIIYDVLTGPERTTTAVTTVGSFVAGLKAQPGVNAAAVDALLAHYNMGPITDAWGTGDANLRAMYLDTPVPTSGYGMLLTGGRQSNSWYQNQYFVLTGNGAQMTVTTTCAQDVDLFVLQSGQVLTSATSASGNETVHFPTTAGVKYVVSLRGFSATAADYPVTLNFTSP